MKEGWEYKKLGDVGSFMSGYTPKKEELNNKSGVPYFKVSDMNRDENGYEMNRTELFVKHPKKLFPAGAIIFPKNGGAIFTEKKRFLVCDSIIDLNTEAILANESFLKKEYLFYLLTKVKISTFDNGGGLPSVNIKKMCDYEICVPPLSEQQSIVDYLDSAFAKIDAMKANAEKTLNEAKALFQASLKEMLEPKEGWKEKYLKDIAQYSIGLTYKPTNVCDDGTIVLRSSNIQEGKLDLNDIVRVNAYIKEELYVRCGDILMCSRNGSARLVGKVCIIPELKEKMTYGTFMMVIRSAYNPLLYHYFDTGLFRSQIKHGEANMINQITRYMLDEVKLNIPPLSEQQSIVATLDSLKSKIDRLQENYNKISQECDALKQAILRQVFE